MLRPGSNSPEDDRYTHGLLERLRAGDSEAGNELFAVHRERLLRAMRHALRPEMRGVLDEEELVQATLHKAVARLEGFEWRGKGAFLAWLVNMAVNRLRDEAKRRRVASHGSSSAVLAAVAAREGTPSEAAVRREEQDLLERGMDQLEELDRTLIINRKILEQDYQSLAVDLRMTEGAVRMRVHRAMNQLTRWVEQHS
jgi:RNA polymerase sigma-70 factor, ECF subfamily